MNFGLGSQHFTDFTVKNRFRGLEQLSFTIEIFFQFQQYTVVPQTPLLTSQVLKEENEQWPEVQQEMSMALKEMRVDPDQGPML